MNAAQMLAAAGEPNTTAGRAKFHQRFTSKAAFDAWYNSKKEYGGGLTDGIAFPQQPDASSNKAPYYEKGGFFAPNVMPWNGPIGFYEHGGMTDEIAFPQQPTERINFSAFPWQPKYDMGGLPGGSNDMPCLECGGNMAYGGYMQPGGTTEMDQGQYTNGMAQDYMKSLADFNMSAQPMPMGNVQEAGYANYGTEVNNNFNTLDMNAVDQMSSMQDRIDALKNKQTSIFDLGRNMTNIGSSIYQKPMSYKTKTVGSGMMGPAASPVGTSNNWADTRSNMAAKQAAGNMFKEYGGDFFQNGGSENKMNYQNRVQDILMKGQARPTFGQSSAQSYKGNAAQAAANTQGVQNMTQLPQSSQGKYTPEQIAAFQQMMQSFYNQNAYAPSYQAYDPKGQFPMSQFLNNSALKDIAWKGYGRKGKATFRTVYDPSTGKTVQIPTDQSKQARNYDSTKTGQEAKGPGFIKNLIAKNKQRKAGKQATKDNTQPPTTNQQAFTSGYPSVHIAPTNPNSIFPQKYPASPYDANMPQHFLPTSNMNPAGFPVWNNVNLEPAKGYGPGLAFGGTPYEEGAELEMDEEAIANYLAMGGTLEYLD